MHSVALAHQDCKAAEVMPGRSSCNNRKYCIAVLPRTICVKLEAPYSLSAKGHLGEHGAWWRLCRLCQTSSCDHAWKIVFIIMNMEGNKALTDGTNKQETTNEWLDSMVLKNKKTLTLTIWLLTFFILLNIIFCFILICSYVMKQKFFVFALGLVKDMIYWKYLKHEDFRGDF